MTRERRIASTRIWLRKKGIELTDEVIQVNVFFTLMVAGDSITHMVDNFNREYFIERVEHMVARTLATSVYPNVSLGPGQRFASKGSYVVLWDTMNQVPKPLSSWIVP